MFYKNYRHSIKIIPLLLLIGIFTIIPSFGQNNNIDWNQICSTVAISLYHSCDTYVNSFNQLTYEGQRAMSCIINGLALGGGAVALGTPLEVIIPGLDILAGMTGCNEIVKLDLLSNLGNPNQILNMLTQSGVNNIVPPNNFYERSNLQTDFNQNTLSQNEFKLFNNELFSVEYPSDWEYKQDHSLRESNVYFKAKNNLGGDTVITDINKTEVKNLDELILNVKNQQLTSNLINDTDSKVTDISKENIYLGEYPALKVTAILNSESIPFQKFIGFFTIANGKTYAIMLLSNPSDPSATNPIFEKMVSSFDIFPISTTDTKSSFDNDVAKSRFENLFCIQQPTSYTTFPIRIF